MKAYADPDYGPYTGHPLDPRAPEDERDFADLTPAEQRAELSFKTRAELIELVLTHAEDARLWQEVARRANAARRS